MSQDTITHSFPYMSSQMPLIGSRDTVCHLPSKRYNHGGYHLQMIEQILSYCSTQEHKVHL